MNLAIRAYSVGNITMMGDGSVNLLRVRLTPRSKVDYSITVAGNQMTVIQRSDGKRPNPRHVLPHVTVAESIGTWERSIGGKRHRIVFQPWDKESIQPILNHIFFSHQGLKVLL